MFLVTFPEQYVYNPAFQLKVLCLMLAGLNVVLFYLTSFRRIATSVATAAAAAGRLSGAVSLGLWITVIVCGRIVHVVSAAQDCHAADVVSFLADCVVR